METSEYFTSIESTFQAMKVNAENLTSLDIKKIQEAEFNAKNIGINLEEVLANLDSVFEDL